MEFIVRILPFDEKKNRTPIISGVRFYLEKGFYHSQYLELMDKRRGLDLA